MSITNQKCFECHVHCASSRTELCYFCWFDFKANDDEKEAIRHTESFRQKSIYIWYVRTGIPRMAAYFWSPEIFMHYFHDCFRTYGTTVEQTLQLAGEIFDESVTWLRNLIDGKVPNVSQPNDPYRIYEFGRGAGRTPIWYVKHNRWYWSPHLPTKEWIRCPQLIVSYGPWHGQVPREENIFIILFLHRYRPEPRISIDSGILSIENK